MSDKSPEASLGAVLFLILAPVMFIAGLNIFLSGADISLVIPINWDTYFGVLIACMGLRTI